MWLQSKKFEFQLTKQPNICDIAALPPANAVAVAGASLCSILFGLARKAHKSCSLLFVPPPAILFYAIHPFISFVKIE